MSIFDLIRCWAAAKVLSLATLLVPPGTDGDLTKRYITNACSTMMGTLGHDDD